MIETKTRFLYIFRLIRRSRGLFRTNSTDYMKTRVNSPNVEENVFIGALLHNFVLLFDYLEKKLQSLCSTE